MSTMARYRFSLVLRRASLSIRLAEWTEDTSFREEHRGARRERRLCWKRLSERWGEQAWVIDSDELEGIKWKRTEVVVQPMPALVLLILITPSAPSNSISYLF